MTETPVVIYAAKSTEDKHGSIPTQLDDCRALAKREDWHVVGEFSDEGFSAYKGNRGPDLARAIIAETGLDMTRFPTGPPRWAPPGM